MRKKKNTSFPDLSCPGPKECVVLITYRKVERPRPGDDVSVAAEPKAQVIIHDQKGYVLTFCSYFRHKLEQNLDLTL